MGRMGRGLLREGAEHSAFYLLRKGGRGLLLPGKDEAEVFLLSEGSSQMTQEAPLCLQVPRKGWV